MRMISSSLRNLKTQIIQIYLQLETYQIIRPIQKHFTWHSVAYFTGEGDEDTSSFQIKGNRMKVKVKVKGLNYGTATFYIYPKSKTVGYVDQGSVSSFSKSSNTDEFNITVSPDSYYLKVESEDQSNWDMNWKIEVFDYIKIVFISRSLSYHSLLWAFWHFLVQVQI